MLAEILFIGLCIYMAGFGMLIESHTHWLYKYSNWLDNRRRK